MAANTGFGLQEGTGVAAGAGFVVPDSATIPFADLAARNTWAAANLGDLVQGATVVSVTGSPSNTWFLWRGDTNPGSHDAANWIDATPLVRGEMGNAGQDGMDGADGRIQSLTAGSRISVDSTDPANPVISADRESFTTLSDTPAALLAERYIRVNTDGDGLELVELDPITSDERSKLNGIEEGAEVNVQPDWDETTTSSDAFIQNKPVIPAQLTDLTDTPAAITANQFMRGNAGGTAIEFAEVSPGSGSTTWTGLTDTPGSITANQFVRGNAGGTALEFVTAPTGSTATGPFTLTGVVEITADVTITSDNLDTYDRQLWQFMGGDYTVTVSAGTGLTYFALHVRPAANTATITGDDSTVSFNNNQTIVFGGRSSAAFYPVITDRFRTLFSNSVGVSVSDSGIAEGTQITDFNFRNNLAAVFTDGVAIIDAVSEQEQLSEPQRNFIGRLIRDPLSLDTQQTGFDFDVIQEPINTVDTGLGSDLAALNARNTNEFTDALNSGIGFVYILFQNAIPDITGWRLVRTNAARDTVVLLADIADDFVEIDIAGTNLNLLMSNIRYRYMPDDVLAIYTLTGNQRIFIDNTDDIIDVSAAIPDDSITTAKIPDDSIPQSKLNFAITGSLEWRACTLSSTTGTSTTATLPASLTLDDFHDISVLWNSGTGTPTDGDTGNINRYVTAQGSLAPLAEVPTDRSMIIGVLGRGATQYAIQVQGTAQTSTTLQIQLIDINSTTVPAGFDITHAWVR